MGKDAGKKRWWPDKSNNQINNIWTILFSNYRMALAIGSCRVQSNVEFFSHDKTLTSVNSECLRTGIDTGWFISMAIRGSLKVLSTKSRLVPPKNRVQMHFSQAHIHLVVRWVRNGYTCENEYFGTLYNTPSICLKSVFKKIWNNCNVIQLSCT